MRARALLLLFSAMLTAAAFGAPATAFRVTLPETAIYYEAFDFTVEAIDGTGAIDPTYTETVTFSASGDFFATLPPNYTFTAGDAGAHVFSAMFTAYGDNRSISVTDINNATITGSDTANVRYAPGATQRFVISAPATGNLGEPFNFTVTAADIDGNPTSNYTGTVELASHGVTVPSGYTFTPADGGTKTFTGTPTRGGYVLFNLHDIDYPGVAHSHSMQIACPGFTVTASNDSPVCPNEAPTLTASTTETGATFDWQGPRFWSASGQVVSGVMNYAGTYLVVMSHSNGCSAFAQTEVTLSSTNPDVQAVSDPLHACDTLEKTFAIVDTATNGPYTNIVWSVTGSGSIVSGQGTPSVTLLADYEENGPAWQSMDLYLSATNGAGCVIDEALVESHIFVYPRPVATIDTPSSACAGTTHTAKPVLAPSPINSRPAYAWSIENGTITQFDQTSGEIRYTVSGEGDAVLTLVTTDAYCSYTTTASVSPGPSATIASASYDICAGESVEIPVTLTGQAPFTIGWSDGALQTGVTSSFTRSVTPNESTHYSIVSVSDANCSGGTGTGNVEVMTRNDAVITQQPANTTVARGARATLTVDVEPDATAIQWYQGLPGDHSQPVSGGTLLELTTPPITQTTSFWAEIETSCGTVASNAATVTVSSRRRAARHP
jgi:hypothetical protein